MKHSTALNAQRRRQDLEFLSEGGAVDVLVIGGGVTGTGVALDVASRGLSVALVEKHDLAFGTSRWSSKLIHGGLRYLAHGDIGLAWESARERHLLLTRIAPHLVHPLPLIVPASHSTTARRKVATWMGLRAGNTLRSASGTTSSRLPAPRRIRPAEAAMWFPALDERHLSTGGLYWDGQLEDDARLTVDIARTAAGFGARIITRCSATEIGPGHVTLADELTGTSFSMRPRFTVNAAGVWADQLTERVHLQPSKGVHLVIHAERLGLPRAGLTVPVPGSFNRFILALPWSHNLALIGVTDDPLDGAVPDVAPVTAADTTFLLDILNPWLTHPLTEADVAGSFAGLRPLLAGDSGDSTSDLSRHHVLDYDADRRLLSIVGGKLTTYRHMAEQGVDLLLSHDHREQPCSTAAIPLVGAASRAALGDLRQPAHLVRRYGMEAGKVASADDVPNALDTIVEGVPLTHGEVAFAYSHEGALSPEDIVDRRSRIGLVDEWRQAALSAISDASPAVAHG